MNTTNVKKRAVAAIRTIVRGARELAQAERVLRERAEPAAKRGRRETATAKGAAHA